jgi:hypothetical protein
MDRERTNSPAETEEREGGGGFGGRELGPLVPPPQGAALEKSQELLFSLGTVTKAMLKYDPQAWIFTHCKAGRTVN